MRTLQSRLTLPLILLLGAGTGFADTVILQSKDGQDFKIEVKLAKQSETLKIVIEDAGTDAPIPLPNIDGKTLSRLVDFFKAKESERNLNTRTRESWGALPTSNLIELAIAVNYLQVRINNEDDLLRAVLKVYGDRIFSSGQLKWVSEKDKDKDSYPKYISENLNIPREMAEIVIAQSLGSIDRIFLSHTKDRRIEAIRNTPLEVAQIVAHIARHNTPSFAKLPKHFRHALQTNGYNEKNIYFGAMPTEYAIWPAHCPLPGRRDYNMYADDTPDERFTDNGDGTVTDRCTLLMWEKARSTRPLPWAPSKAHCSKLEKANYRDWRLPRRVELQSIVDYTKTAPASNAIFGGDIDASSWSSTPYANNTEKAWYVSFFSGVVDSGEIINHYNAVRCVRSTGWDTNASEALNKKGTVEHYTLSQNTVTDNFTGLEWQKVLTDGEGKNFNNAHSHCSALDLGGSKGFRVPMVKELSTPLDLRNYNPAIDGVAFPKTPLRVFSSSTPRAGVTSLAWVVYFSSGSVGGNHVYLDLRVRCAR
jgi:hypothetical protein